MKSFKIPRGAIGRPLTEARIKQGLLKLCPDLEFDYAGRHGIEHPYIDYRQGVYWTQREEGRQHICSMDRGKLDGGVVPEVPVWDMAEDVVELEWSEVSDHELLTQEPPFPMPCFHDENKLQIMRQVRNDVIFCGWRHTFDKLIAARVEGITRHTIEEEFSVSLDFYIDTCELTEEPHAAPWNETDGLGPEEGKLLDEMGVYEARPTIVLTDG